MIEIELCIANVQKSKAKVIHMHTHTPVDLLHVDVYDNYETIFQSIYIFQIHVFIIFFSPMAVALYIHIHIYIFIYTICVCVRVCVYTV